VRATAVDGFSEMRRLEVEFEFDWLELVWFADFWNAEGEEAEET